MRLPFSHFDGDEGDCALYEMEIKDCCGRTLSLQSIEIGDNLIEAAVPKAGVVRLIRKIAEGQAHVKP
ncbi:hypothetical protein MJ257_06325 [Paenibacillus timonensis]|uniref:Uncharacterized protein n=1 Tax=Paenibacillus timonensis TaxID=225915 RepID=A0ABW3S798_9BACL|nr:hypothetical protein [Paenibacillus timonensis]MCH1639710.1 hypothetical protein [Paenibacillus timonensis]